MNHSAEYLLFLALLFSTSISQAETIHIPVGQQAPELEGMEVPQRNMLQDEVEARFGVPDSRSQPVGDPPISYWDYPQYRVYFENDRVIHSVLKDSSLKSRSQ